MQASKCVEYDSIFEAKARCNENKNCTIVINFKGQNRYRLCGVSAELRYSSQGSISFLKQAGKIQFNSNKRQGYILWLLWPIAT